MTRPYEAVAGEHQQMVLRETLDLAVPLHIAELRGMTPRALTSIASDAATTVGSHGDALQFGGKHCAEAFNALARGLAAAALVAPGGVDALGGHWCPDPGCRASSRFNHADDTPPQADTPPCPAPRPLADVIRDLADYQPTPH